MNGKTAGAPGRVILLAGNPNSGKTSVFNWMAGAHQHVGNYPGVTVEKKSAVFTRGKTSVRGSIGCRDAAPQVEARRGHTGMQGMVVKARRMQKGTGFPGLCGQVFALQFAACFQAGAALCAGSAQGVSHRRLREIVHVQQGAGHQACGQRAVVV